MGGLHIPRVLSADTAEAGALLLSRGDKSPSSVWPALIPSVCVCVHVCVRVHVHVRVCSWSPLVEPGEAGSLLLPAFLRWVGAGPLFLLCFCLVLGRTGAQGEGKRILGGLQGQHGARRRACSP